MLVVLAAMAASQLAPRDVDAEGDLSIAGTVWHDRDFDGVRDPEDEGLVNVTLTLISPGVGDVPNLANVRTDAQGRYVFTNLSPGRHLLRTFSAAATYPARIVSGQIETTITLNASIDNADFGLVRVEDLLIVRGTAWSDGVPRPSAGPLGVRSIRAFVGDRDCTVESINQILPTDQPQGSFLVYVAPDGLISGCGRAGATVRFTIEGRPVNETLAWSTTPTQSFVTLTAGPPFALFAGSIDPLIELASNNRFEVDAFIEGNDCGELYGTFGGFMLVVLPEALRAGCASEGVKIELRIAGRTTNAQLVWSPGARALDLQPYVASIAGTAQVGTPVSKPGITPPAAGDGGLLAR